MQKAEPETLRSGPTRNRCHVKEQSPLKTKGRQGASPKLVSALTVLEEPAADRRTRSCGASR